MTICDHCGTEHAIGDVRVVYGIPMSNGQLPAVARQSDLELCSPCRERLYRRLEDALRPPPKAK